MYAVHQTYLHGCIHACMHTYEQYLSRAATGGGAGGGLRRAWHGEVSAERGLHVVSTSRRGARSCNVGRVSDYPNMCYPKFWWTCSVETQADWGACLHRYKATVVFTFAFRVIQVAVKRLSKKPSYHTLAQVYFSSAQTARSGSWGRFWTSQHLPWSSELKWWKDGQMKG